MRDRADQLTHRVGIAIGGWSETLDAGDAFDLMILPGDEHRSERIVRLAPAEPTGRYVSPQGWILDDDPDGPEATVTAPTGVTYELLQVPGEASNLSTPVAFKPVDGYRSAMMWSYAGAAFAATGTDVREALSPANASWPRPAASADPAPADHGTERIGVKGHCNDDEGNNADVNITWDGHRFQYEPSTSGELQEDLEGGLGILLAFLEDGHGGCDEDDHLEIHVEIGGIRFAFCVFGDGSFAFGKNCPHTNQDPSVGSLPEVYDDDENRVCYLPYCFFRDTDCDGDVDGLDPDNDGDLLTDEFEGKNAGHDYNRQDTDGEDDDADGNCGSALNVPDGLDIDPDGDATMDITVGDIDLHQTSDGCDTSINPPDPYIDDDGFKIKTYFGVGSVSLIPPPGLAPGDGAHVDGRYVTEGPSLNDGTERVAEAGDVNDGTLNLPDNIEHYTIDEPGDTVAELHIPLMDHDDHPFDGGGDNPIDLNPSSGTTGVWEFALVTTEDGPDIVTQSGDDQDCSAESTVEDHAYVRACDVRKALKVDNTNDVVTYASGVGCNDG